MKKGTTEHIASRIALARAEANKSQAECGEALGVKYQQFQKYEKGANRISADTLAMLAKFLKKPITFFFE